MDIFAFLDLHLHGERVRCCRATHPHFHTLMIFVGRGVVDFCEVEATVPGGGAWRRLVQVLGANYNCVIKVSNVGNAAFAKHLEGHGFRRYVTRCGDVCFEKPA